MSTEIEVAIVTNATQGIGLSIVRKLASRGINVLLVDLKEELGKAATIGVRDDYKVDAHFFKGDVTKEEDIRAMVQEAVSRWGRLDWAANNFGAIEALHKSSQNVDQLMALNRRTISLCQKYEAEQMMKQELRLRRVSSKELEGVLERGSIVNIVVGHSNATMELPVCLPGKDSSVSQPKSGGMVYGNYGIRCNSISLGSTFGPGFRELNGQSDLGKAPDWSTRYPVTKSSRCEEQANVVNFLLSGESSVVNGVDIRVDSCPSTNTGPDSQDGIITRGEE